MTTLVEWMRTATTDEHKRLAELSGLALGYIKQVSTGARNASADAAGRIVEAANEIRKKSKGRLPRLRRADICMACYFCPHCKRSK